MPHGSLKIERCEFICEIYAENGRSNNIDNDNNNTTNIQQQQQHK